MCVYVCIYVSMFASVLKLFIPFFSFNSKIMFP